MATSATRSIEIDASVEKVFGFVADPERLMNAVPGGRTVVVSDIETSPDGAVSAYKWSTRFPMLRYDLRGACTRPEHVANERIVEKHSTGKTDTITFTPSGTGTRLTYSSQFSARNPLVGKLGILIATRGRGIGRKIEEYLGAIKYQLEAQGESGISA